MNEYRSWKNSGFISSGDIKVYDNDIVLYPGHNESTTLGYEKENNQYLEWLFSFLFSKTMLV